MNYPHSPKRVEAGEKQEFQKNIRTLDDVPARYRSYPDFDALTIDPAHGDRPEEKTIREAVSAVEAVMSGALKGPVTRGTEAYIDFYDADGHPVDVKTPLSPSRTDKWEFDYVTNADTILKQLDKDYENRLTGKREPVTVLLDSTYLSKEDHAALWRELRRRTKEDRSVLNGITEVCAQIEPLRKERALTEKTMAILNNRRGR